MRLVSVLHSAQLSGAELNVHRLAVHRRGVEVSFVLLQNGPLAQLMDDTQVPHILLGSADGAKVHRGSALVDKLRLLANLMRQGWVLSRHPVSQSSDVVSVHSFKSAVVGVVAAKIRRKPLVWSVHDRVSADYYGRSTAAIGRALIGRLSNGIIVNSQATADALGPVDRPVLICPPSVVMSQRTRGAEVRGRLRVVVLGRLSPWKGQEVALSAFGAALRGTDSELVIAGGPLFGEDAYAAGLVGMAESLGISDQVTFTGHLTDVGSLLSDADVLVHASVLPEPFGAVVIEGMLYGCCVIASAAGGPTEVVQDGINGLLYPPGDVNRLASLLDRAFRDRDMLKSLAVAGRSTAEQFDVRRLANGADAWLADVVAGHAAGVTNLMPTR